VSAPLNCPICFNAHETKSLVDPYREGYVVDCEACGRFNLSKEAWEDFLDPNCREGKKLSPVYRSRLSHRIQESQKSSQGNRPTVVSSDLEAFIRDGCPGPTPAQQAANLLRIVGDEISRTGHPLMILPKSIHAIIGSPNRAAVSQLMTELIQMHHLSGTGIGGTNAEGVVVRANMTLTGWQAYEAEQSGKFAGKYGFIAMKFGKRCCPSRHYRQHHACENSGQCIRIGRPNSR
jgi:hypothetical protein